MFENQGQAMSSIASVSPFQRHSLSSLETTKLLVGDNTRLGTNSQKSERKKQKFSKFRLLSTLTVRATMKLTFEKFYPAGIETRISQMEQTITHQHTLLLQRLDLLSTLLFVRTPSANYPERPAWAPPVSVSSPLSPSSLPADPPVPTSPLNSGLPTQMTSTPPIKPWQLPSPAAMGLGAEHTAEHTSRDTYCQHMLQHSTTSWRLVARSPEIGLFSSHIRSLLRLR